MPSGSGGIFYGVYPGRSAGADGDVSGDLGRIGSSRSRMSSYRGVCGAAEHGQAGLCTCRASRDGTSGVRSTRSAETVSVRIFAAGAVVASAGGRVPAQRRSDVAAGTFATGLQVDRRVSADAQPGGDRSGGGVGAFCAAGGVGEG